jgi:hypothetical protein
MKKYKLYFRNDCLTAVLELKEREGFRGCIRFSCFFFLKKI